MKNLPLPLLGAALAGCDGATVPAPELPCDVEIHRVHTDAALGGHARVRDVLWDRTGGYTRFTVEGFDADVTSLTLELDQPGIEAWFAKADAKPTSEDIHDYRPLGSSWDAPAEVEPWFLEGHREAGLDALHFLVATPEPMEWTACVTLDRSPYLMLDAGPAIPVGGMLDLDHGVWNDEEGVRIFTEDPLPGWVSWDEETGRVTGSPTEAGVWEITVVAEGPGGRRELPSGIASYQPEPLACNADTPLRFTTDRGAATSPWAVGGDPRSFGSFQTELPATVSSATLRVAGLERLYSAFAGFARPEVGATELSWVADPADATEVEVTVDTKAWPSLRDVRSGSGVLVSRTGNLYQEVSRGRVWLECDERPRLDLLALPVMPLGEPMVWQLPAHGGVPPIRWQADGLPTGVSLSTAGHLDWTGLSTPGHHEIELTLTDSVGATFTDVLDLWIGDESVVEGPILHCGETLRGTLGEDRYLHVHLATEARRSRRLEVLASFDDAAFPSLGFGDPNGAVRVEHVPPDLPVFRVIDERSTIPLSAYAERPILFEVRDHSPDTRYELELTCRD